MMKGPFRELIPVDADVTISIPANKKPAGVHLLISGRKPVYDIRSGKIHIKVLTVMDQRLLG